VGHVVENEPLVYDVADLRAAASSILLERLQFLRQAGISFGGARDLYNILGYDRDISNKQHRDRYARGGIAGRIVDAMPNATWRGGWELIEDEDPKVSTEFEKAWVDLEKRLKIGAVLRRVDILAGLSQYAVLLIGSKQSGELDSELKKGKPEDLIYLTPFSGGGGPILGHNRSPVIDADATIDSFVTDPRDPRFGLPAFYRLKRIDIMTPDFMRPVHWSRVIHIAEGVLDDEVYGAPALERCWNLLDDLDKVTGGGAEAFWLRANQGIQLDVDREMQLSPEEKTNLQTQADEYQHQIRRMLRTRGVTVTPLGSDVANFGNPADAILTQIAGAKAIPKRILTGSEMGELASSQDRDNWKDQVNGRQTGYAGPYIVRPLVDRLIAYGYLPEPRKGPDAYEVKWSQIQVLTEAEKSEGASKWAATKTDEGPVFNRDEIRDKWYGMEPIPKAELDEATGEHISPETGEPVVPKIDPATGLPLKGPTPDDVAAVDPETGLPLKDPDTGEPVVVDPKSGLPVVKKKPLPFRPRAAAAAWHVDKRGMTRAFTFADRRACASFLAALALDANAHNHHPDVTVVEDTVTVTYVTHSAGDTVTSLDRDAADRANRIAETIDPRIADPRLLEHKFSSTQVNLPSDWARDVEAIAAGIDPDDLSPDESQDDAPHITVKYGLHTLDPDEVRAVVSGFGPVTLWLGDLNIFETDEYDVLYVEVESDDLVALNERIANALEVTDTYPDYVPHATVAYLKKGRGAGYVQEDLFSDDPIEINELVFTSKDDARTVISLVDEGDTSDDDELLAVLQEAVATGNTEVVEAITGMKAAGGPGSGNFGHIGRPGQIGGSASAPFSDAGGGGGASDERVEHQKRGGRIEHDPEDFSKIRLLPAPQASSSLKRSIDTALEPGSYTESLKKFPEGDSRLAEEHYDAMRGYLSEKGFTPTETKKGSGWHSTEFTNPSGMVVRVEKAYAGPVPGDRAKGYRGHTAVRLRVIRNAPKTLGGPGSGNFGHSGRPGQIGGSASAPFSDSGGGTAAWAEGKAVATDLRREVRSELRYRSDDDISEVKPTFDNKGWEFDARDFGSWENPPEARREEDYDWQVPTASTYKKLQDIGSRFETRNRGMKFLFSVEEKNWITFSVRPGTERALGGEGSGNFGHAGRPGIIGGSSPTSRAQASARFNELKAEWSRVNDSLFKSIDDPESPVARIEIERMKSIVKEMHTLEADPGGLEGIGLPGGPRDVVIVGAGPGGLSAAVMGGAEGLDTMVVEAETRTGGQSKFSSRVENYPGFPAGVTGERLATDMTTQAERMGAEHLSGVRVTELSYDAETDLKTVTFSDGRTVEARSVIVAGGVAFKRATWPGGDDPQVFYGDSRSLADASVGRPTVVAGGSNGAAQAALLAAQTSSHVTVVSRKPIDASMSDYQVSALRSHPKITVLEGSEISGFVDKRVQLTNGGSVPADAVGVFFGGRATNEWLPPIIKRDAKGKIITSDTLETDIPGVFAIGDARAGSIGRIGMSVGDGQFAIHGAFRYFDKLRRVGRAFTRIPRAASSDEVSE
jgi:thioredoxin reductase/pterin-4a-carbinolamine dehydratase/2'-5' RNA ligase